MYNCECTHIFEGDSMSNNMNFDWRGKRVVITGATGLIGGTVARMLTERGAAVVIFSRDPDAARKTLPGMADYVAWQPEIPTANTAWVKAIDGAYAVVHCAAPSLFGKRMNEADIRVLSHNRITSTRGLAQAMSMVASKPAVFVSSASQGTYGFPRQISDAPVDESAPAGNDFWGQDSIPWEQAALEAEKLGVRVVPQKALDLGFEFHYPTIDKALADLVPKITAK